MKPFPFQAECVRIAVQKLGGRALFSLDMGLGKTAVSLWTADRLRAFPLVVVCPASLKWQWQAEVEKVLRRKSRVLEGTRAEDLPRRPGVVIVNYDVLGAWVGELKRLQPKAVVLDECHYAANPKAKRTKHAQRLCRGVPHVMALSGTPLVNRPIELFPSLNVLRPDVFRSRFKFGLRYCAGRHNGWGWEFKGASRTKELHGLLERTCMVRRRKPDVLHELPDKLRQVVPVDVADRGEYERAEEDFVAWLAEQDPEAAVRAARAAALTRTGHLLRLAAKLKCRSVVEWCNEWLAGCDGKLIVFAVHKKMVRALARRLKCEAVVVDGGVAGRERQQRVGRFQRDRRTRVLVGNVQAAGVGLNLTAASTVAFAELPWQPGAVTQAEDRAHRIGQRRCVDVKFLVARGTVEEARCAVIMRKQAVVSAVLDGRGGGEDLDVFVEFVEELAK